MNIIDIVKKHSYEGSNELYNKLKQTFLEMSQIKSEFDMEKLSTQTKGNFPAHNYHMLIRQYSLTLGEVRRMNLDREEKIREIEVLKKILDSNQEKIGDKFVDIEIRRCENAIDQLEIDIANKAYRIEYYEKLRQKLIKINGGQEPTNEQYQKEEPDFIKWYLEKEMYHDMVSRQTGIRIGVIDNIENLERKPLLNNDFQRFIDKKMDVDKHQLEENKQREILNRYQDDSPCIE